MHKKMAVQHGVKRRPLFVGGAALAAVLASCGTSETTSAVIGSQGGVVSLESGLRLEVPQGAVASPVQVTLRETSSDGYADIHIEPAGLALGAAAALSWADDVDGALESDDATEQLVVERSLGRANAHVHHFGHFRHWGHCGKDGGCPRHARDDGGTGSHGKGDCDGGACGGDGHGGCSGNHDGGRHDDGDDNHWGQRPDAGSCHHDGDGCPGNHHGGTCSHDGGTPAPVDDAGLPTIP